MKLSILIVNWNTRKQIEECLDSIQDNPPGFEYEIVVVDNASSDGSAELLSARAERDGQIKFIASDENLGFARGNNRAYERSSGDYILLLNPDTKVKPGALDALASFLDEHKQMGIVGPKLLNPDGSIQPSVRRFPDVWSSVLVLSGLHRVLKPSRYLMTGFDHGETAEVDQVMGAALMTRREVVEQVGLFDERFYLWYEEVDFCKRVKGAGWQVMFYPKAEVVHLAAQSFSQLAVWSRKKIAARSLLYYFRKNGKILEVLLLYLAMPLILIPAWLVSLVGIKSKIRTS